MLDIQQTFERVSDKKVEDDVGQLDFDLDFLVFVVQPLLVVFERLVRSRLLRP